MEVLIIRHGIAEERQHGKSDSERHLTGEGREKSIIIGKCLKKLCVKLDLALTSPFARAYETAEIIINELGLDNSVIKISKNLEPEANWNQVFDEFNNKETVALFGHDPMFSEMVSSLLSCNSSLNTPLKKGGICKIKLESLNPPYNGELIWFIPPKVFISLA